jgi:hypothetical protein
MKNLGYIILTIILMAIAVWIKGKYFPNEVTKTKTKTITKVDTVYQDSLVYKQLPAPDPDTIKLIDKDTITIPTDTTIFERYADLFQKYHSQYIYDDTLKNDSSAFIAVHEIISKNRITRRELYYRNRSPVTVYNETNIINQRKFFVGGVVGENVIEPRITYKDLNDIMYSVGYDFIGPEQGIRFGVQTSISGIFN